MTVIASPRRLAAVRASALLDSPGEEAFDRLTSLAATLLEAPFAFTTVVDDRRSFWKSCIGTDPAGPRENAVEESFCQYVVGSGSELIVGDVTSDPRTANNPSIELMGVRAWAGFPLFAPDGEVLGSFCVVDQRTREWTERDVEVLRVLAAAAAGEVSLRSALAEANRERERAAALALTLQENLLPPALPEIEGLDLAAGHRPAGTGTELVGDFYDVYPLEEGRWSVAVGDVCGKGVEAAKTTALARHSLAAAALRSPLPSDVLRVLGEALLARERGDVFVTAIFGWMRREPGGFRVDLASGGHCPGLVVRSGGAVEVVTGPGTLLGMLRDVRLTDTTTHLRPGDMLVLYTDGVTEARTAGEQFGEERLMRVLADADGLDAASVVARVEAAVSAFSPGPSADDRAVVVIRVLHAAA